eukprot:CAMPEP_0172584568 /NCGR_PEP_ID=MMETSP1068-20121228/4179_1 /TAXON_ID=35684 /ORGANISM="Pseudopedinella elastica, Strain CCMP716" /LENGTH=387 /DNA_ID=CAMNT_0013378803 /DNA_START=57 /DNA_END=1220 /DNA_ORIENTATION=-
MHASESAGDEADQERRIEALRKEGEKRVAKREQMNELYEKEVSTSKKTKKVKKATKAKMKLEEMKEAKSTKDKAAPKAVEEEKVAAEDTTVANATEEEAAAEAAEEEKFGAEAAVKAAEEEKLTATKAAEEKKAKAADKEKGSKPESIPQVASDLIVLCSGLDRGAAARSSDIREVNAKVSRLEKLAPCDLEGPELIDALVGRWRLVYSSTFAGERPNTEGMVSQGFTGAPGGGGAKLGSVFQDITKTSLNNLVEIPLPTPPILLPGMSKPRIRAKLKHAIQVEARKVRIEFEETSVRVAGARGKTTFPAPRKVARDLEKAVGAGPLNTLGPMFESVLEPVLGRARDYEERASSFEVTSMAELPGGTVLRVARSGLGELRIFVREAA